MRLRTAGGQVLEPATVSSALSTLERDTTSTAGAMLFGPLIGLAIDASRMQDAQAERDLQVKVGGQAIFNERSLSAGKAETGLVLFRLPEGVKTAQGATVSSWIVEPAAAHGVRVEAALPAE